MVKFVSYTGKYPNLCSGILTLDIDGKEVTFGHGFLVPKPDYESFWVSGGTTRFTQLDSEVEYGEWIIYKDVLPQEYSQYADEIAEIFNDNVPWGCCGGCL